MRSRSYSTLGRTDEHMHNICICSDEGAYGHEALMSLVMIHTYLYTSSGYTVGLVTVYRRCTETVQSIGGTCLIVGYIALALWASRIVG